MEPIAVVLVLHAWDTGMCRLLHRSVGNSNGGCEHEEAGPRMLAERA
jgi:hypothetical protein